MWSIFSFFSRSGVRNSRFFVISQRYRVEIMIRIFVIPLLHHILRKEWVTLIGLPGLRPSWLFSFRKDVHDTTFWLKLYFCFMSLIHRGFHRSNDFLFAIFLFFSKLYVLSVLYGIEIRYVFRLTGIHFCLISTISSICMARNRPSMDWEQSRLLL